MDAPGFSFDIECECGNTLSGEWKPSGNYDGKTILVVEKCSDCCSAAKSEGA